MELSLQNFCSLLELGWAGLGFFFKVTAFLLQLLGEMLLRSPVQVCNNRIIKTKLKQQKNLILLLFHFVFNITCSAAGAGFRHFFSCSLLELLVPVWAGASNHRIPAKRQIIFQIELSENSVENARKTADFGIESNKNLFRHQLRLGFAKQASCIGCPNQKDSAR